MNLILIFQIHFKIVGPTLFFTWDYSHGRKQQRKKEEEEAKTETSTFLSLKLFLLAIHADRRHITGIQIFIKERNVSKLTGNATLRTGVHDAALTVSR